VPAGLGTAWDEGTEREFISVFCRVFCIEIKDAKDTDTRFRITKRQSS